MTTRAKNQQKNGRARALASTAAALGVAVVLSGCGGSPEVSSRESGSGVSADVLSDVTDVEVFRNIGDYPSVARFCIDDLAFVSTPGTSSGYASSANLLRVPEWDARCGAE